VQQEADSWTPQLRTLDVRTFLLEFDLFDTPIDAEVRALVAFVNAHDTVSNPMPALRSEWTRLWAPKAAKICSRGASFE